MKFLSILFILLPGTLFAQEIKAPYVKMENKFFENPSPSNDVWNKAQETKIILLPQNITTPSLFQNSVASLTVRSVHNGKWLAILVEWEDPTQSRHVSNDDFSDACALQFPLMGADKTSPFMGNKGAPVSILHWKAIWQFDIDDHYQQVSDLFPNTWVDTYQFGKNVAIDVGNPVSRTDRNQPVEELRAEGFGTLTTDLNQGARGRGVWQDGKWHVVVARKLRARGKMDLEPGKPTALAFAIWEGGHKNVGARKNYAPWIPLIMEKSK